MLTGGWPRAPDDAGGAYDGADDFAQPDAQTVHEQHARIVAQLEERFPDAAALLDQAAPRPAGLHRVSQRLLAPALVKQLAGAA